VARKKKKKEIFGGPRDFSTKPLKGVGVGPKPAPRRRQRSRPVGDGRGIGQGPDPAQEAELRLGGSQVVDAFNRALRAQQEAAELKTKANVKFQRELTKRQQALTPALPPHPDLLEPLILDVADQPNGRKSNGT